MAFSAPPEGGRDRPAGCEVADHQISLDSWGVIGNWRRRAPTSVFCHGAWLYSACSANTKILKAKPMQYG